MSSLLVLKTPMRLSFAQLFEPRLNTMNNRTEYSATLMIPKSDTALVKKIQDAIQAELESDLSKFPGNQIPRRWRSPLRDADDPDDRMDGTAQAEKYPEFAGHYYIRASMSDTTTSGVEHRPGVFDRTGAALEKGEMKSGDWVRARINLSAYPSKGSPNTKNFGVSAYLLTLVLDSEGEPLGAISDTRPDDLLDADEVASSEVGVKDLL